MPVYEFRCARDHRHEAVLPISSAERESPCPDCGRPARRLISAPGLHRLGSARARAIGAAEDSAHAPAIVDHLPGRPAPATPRTADPRHARLPRP